MLVTLEAMKTYLGISGTADDDFLNQQITLISDTIQNYCRRIFPQTTYTQTFYGTDYSPTVRMELYQFPVISISSIIEDGQALSSSDYRINKPTGWIIRPSGWFFCNVTETVVTYSAGYATIPTPLQDVVFSLVEERYNKKKSGISLNFGTDVQRISIPGTLSVDFDYSLNNNERKNSFGAILGSSLNILDFYRSERVISGNSKLIYVG